MAELPELETLRRELEKEAVGKRFKAPEVTGTKAVRHNGTKKALPGPPRGRQGEVRRSARPAPRRQPRQRRAARHRARSHRPAREGRAQVDAAEGHRRGVHLHPRRADPPRRPRRQLRGLRGRGRRARRGGPRPRRQGPRPGGRCGVVDVVRPGAPRPLGQAQGRPHGPRRGGRHRPDVQRRDPVGGRPAPRPHVGLALVPGDPPAVPGPRRDPPRGGQAPGHHHRRAPVRGPLRQDRRATRTSSRCTPARASRARAAGPRS